VGYATINDATTNECYNEQFFFYKIRMLNRNRCYKESGVILSADVVRACVRRFRPSRFD